MSTQPKIQWDTLRQVNKECLRGVKKHGARAMIYDTPENDDLHRLSVVFEEAGEVARALTYDNGSTENLEEELLQLGTMALAWLDVLLRRRETIKAEGASTS